MTGQGHPQAIFERAIERGNLPVAEVTVRELGVVSLRDALGLVALAAQKGSGRRSRYAVRWLRRLLEEDENLTVEEAVLAASALAALGGRGHAEAHATLVGMAERASTQPRRARLTS
jgi:hypothetical protein